MSFSDYSNYKIPQFTKPYKPTDDAFKDALNNDFQDIATNYATKSWVTGQISSGGVDWSTFGNPFDILTLDVTGTSPVGISYDNMAPNFNATLINWSNVGDADDVLKINSTNNGIEGMTYSELAAELGVVAGGGETTVFQTMGGWY